MLIELDHIQKTYDGRRYVLNDLSLTAQAGELIIIRGSSGSGKSTLLNLLGLLDVFDGGTYRLQGKEINPRHYNRYAELRSTLIGFIFQSYCLIDSISVQDNILLPFLYSHHPIDGAVLAYLEEILERFHLTPVRHKRVSLLSGGPKQRVAIARAIIKRPPLIIADEPTGNLDEENSQLVVQHLKALTQGGACVVLVTHDKNLLQYGDRTYFLHEGRLTE